jgi:acyl-CoA synthetase (AMP-forming)/AMP-acid ligase II
MFTSHWPDVQIPALSLPEFLLAGAADHPDATALVDGPSGRVTTYGELAAGVRRVAAGLAARGLRKGDVFAILAPNHPEWLIAAYGAMAAGGVVTGINPLYTPDEVAAQLADSGAKYLLTVPPFLPTAVDAANRHRTQVVAFADLLTHGDRPPAVEIDPAVDLAMLPYSSGTSGLPKGVMLTHRACVANVLQQNAAIRIGPADRSLAVAPFFHATGFGVVANGGLHAGAAVVTMPRFDVEGFLGLIQDLRITGMVVVPPIVLALAKHPAVDRYDLSSLRWIGCGAAPLGAELQEACARRLGLPVMQGYGMTEMTATAAVWELGTPVTPGAAGKLLPGVRARIVDVATGADLGPDEAGELWLNTPSAMTGYLHNPAATAATIDDGGWLHTGDIARIDAAGALFVVDRVKELIKVKGFQVAPAELEAVLRAHPAVADAAVVPVLDERAGERPKAFVVRAADVTAEEILAYVAERVAPHKRVRTVEFIDVIPTSPAGKTLRRVLAAR